MAENPETKLSRSIKLLNSDPTSINKNQLNSSTSKMQYSIPKAQRFSQKTNQSFEHKFYDLPSTYSNRSTTFGYGKKLDLSKQYFEKPAPTQYQLKGDFIADGRKGITISAGREIIKNNSVFGLDKGIPGPGQYNPHESDTDLKSKGFSMVSRTKDISNKWIHVVPGPGNYETIDLLNKNLKSANSKVQSVKSSKFSSDKRKSEFEEKIKQNIPGPDIKGESGMEKTAKFHENSGFKFSHSQRQGISQRTKTAIPGPGSQYIPNQHSNTFSEFIN